MAVNQSINNGIDKFIKWLAIVCLLAYIISALQIDIIPENVILPSVLLLGVIGIIALVNIHYKYSFIAKETVYYKVGIILLAFSFFDLVIMLTVQQSTLCMTERLNQEPVSSVFQLVNSIQLGLDVAFDIFYSVGILFTSVAFLVTELKSAVGWYGVLISIPLLVLNLVTFPTPPKESGWIDLGIFTIIWWLLFIQKIHRSKSWQKHLAN